MMKVRCNNMAKFKVNEETRTIKAYEEDNKSQEDFEVIERYRKLGYKVILKPRKPKEYNHIKKDMVRYLEGNINEQIYDSFIDGVEKKKNFLKLKWELIHALQDEEKDKAKKENRDIKKISFETVQEIINKAKSKESNLIANIKKESNVDKSTSNKNKSKANENEQILNDYQIKIYWQLFFIKLSSKIKDNRKSSKKVLTSPKNDVILLVVN